MAGVPAVAPRRWDEALPAAVDPQHRLRYLDEIGVYYQLLYPNILGFQSHVLLNDCRPSSPWSASGRTTTGWSSSARPIRAA